MILNDMLRIKCARCGRGDSDDLGKRPYAWVTVSKTRLTGYYEEQHVFDVRSYCSVECARDALAEAI